MKLMERFQTVFLVSGIGFFLVSFLGMGLAPWTTLKDVKPPKELMTRSELEEKGRQIFIKEACWHCHTQFVRPLATEVLRYGPVSSASEHVTEIPQLFGTRRVGPDLSREAAKRTDDWHYAHFYNPRNTVPWSIMPDFSWLFIKEGDKITPTEDAKALVAYVQSLGKNVKEEMQKADETFAANFKPSSPPAYSSFLEERGKTLFQRECQGCHGSDMDGKGKAQPFLLPMAANLAQSRPTVEYVFTVLNKGIPGSSMPHFRDYSQQDLWAIAFHVSNTAKNNNVMASTQGVSVESSPEIVAKGKTLFETNCTVCHGSNIDGDGPAGKSLKPSPPNLKGLRPTAKAIVWTLENGIKGTAMPSFVNLGNDEKWAIAHYIESQYEK